MNIEELKKIQEELAKKVVLEDLIPLEEIEYVVGVDQAFIGNLVISCAVKLRINDFELVEKVVKVEEVKFPYIPTFLMFREGEPAFRAVEEVVEKRTAIMVDGSGIAHPRRCGLATYIALKSKKPTVGVTKRRLYGELVELNEELSKLVDGGEVIGYAIKTCKKCNPIFVSPGGYISTESALKLVRMCLSGYKLPEPIRIADKMAKEVKRKLQKV